MKLGNLAYCGYGYRSRDPDSMAILLTTDIAKVSDFDAEIGGGITRRVPFPPPPSSVYDTLAYTTAASPDTPDYPVQIP